MPQGGAAAGGMPAVQEQGATRQRRRARLVFAAGLTCLALWVGWDYLAALAWAAVIASRPGRSTAASQP